MVEKETARLYVGLMVLLVFSDNQKDICRRGIVESVSNGDLILLYNGERQAYSLNRIISLRENRKSRGASDG